MSLSRIYLLDTLLVSFIGLAAASSWINYPSDGFATLTHYEIPLDFVASCGCVPDSTHYPTAALSQMAYGSSTAFGPACGKCFNLTLLNTVAVVPTFYPNVTKSIVVKVTDLCPLSVDGWCSGTKTKTNSAGHNLNFDLAYPSEAIPNDFFPSDVATYGYTDFGVWNISYQAAPCEPDWAGAVEASALGDVSNLDSGSVCCPANPEPNHFCKSYSDLHGLPADALPPTASSASCKFIVSQLLNLGMLCILLSTVHLDSQHLDYDRMDCI